MVEKIKEKGSAYLKMIEKQERGDSDILQELFLRFFYFKLIFLYFHSILKYVNIKNNLKKKKTLFELKTAPLSSLFVFQHFNSFSSSRYQQQPRQDHRSTRDSLHNQHQLHLPFFTPPAAPSSTCVIHHKTALNNALQPCTA